MSSTEPDNVGSPEKIGSDAKYNAIDMIAIHREVRRAERLRQLGDVRKFGVFLAEQLSDYVADRLPYQQAQILLKIEDPTLAYCRVAKSVRQSILLEEKLDDEDEDRRAGIAKPAPQPQSQPKAEPAEPSTADRKQALREAADDLYALSRPEIEREKREDLLDDVFDEFEEAERFTGNPTVNLARICIQLDLTPPDWDADDEAAPDRVARLMARWIDHARTVLEQRAARRKASAKGQGPPLRH